MFNFVDKLKFLCTKPQHCIKIRLTDCFGIAIQRGKIYFIYKLHKESTVRIGNIEF